jgi:iron complex transport system substrate-binding protein
MRKYTMMMNRILAKIAMTLLLLALPAAASDYTLSIFGNANEDDTINMQDVTYTELIILEYRDQTELSDAKYDDKINMQDVTQIELVILGKEKELTLIDSEGNTKTISLPVNEILTLNSDCTEAIRAIGAKDRIVGIESATAMHTTFFPEISTLPSVGRGSGPDLEKILEINPDILMAYAPGIYNPGHDGLEDKLEPVVTVVRLNFYKPETVVEDVIKLGYLLGEVENARNYIEWRDEYVDEVEDVVSGISDDDKPRVFIDYGSQRGSSNRMTAARGTGLHQMCVQAGGINIAADLPAGLAPGYPYAELEWILDQEPTVVIGQASGYNTRGGGYETDDDSDLKAYYDEIMGLPGFGEIPAVNNNRIHIMQGEVSGGLADVVGLAYYAEWFHPDLFENMDAQTIHQEYIDEFCGIDFDVAEHGVFVYPQPVES